MYRNKKKNLNSIEALHYDALLNFTISFYHDEYILVGYENIKYHKYKANRWYQGFFFFH